ncbi:MAG: fuconate dehydratase [Sphingomonadales bacterium]|nr:fuconate dehydratase [Sphingomonadales bacterium]
MSKNTVITGMQVDDVRFPTSASLAGSDAMNSEPDYSAAYLTLTTTSESLVGNGLTFTIGRGTQLCAEAARCLETMVVGRSLGEIIDDMAGFWRSLVGESQLRWLGPEKGVVHLAAAAVLNAIWDLWARHEGKPVWRLVADFTPEEFVSTIDFRHMHDVLDEEEALSILRAAQQGKAERIETLLKRGYPAYTTSVGWLGYSDDKLRTLCKEAVADGWEAIKLKVGKSLDDDRRRLMIARETVGPDVEIMIDANQVWEVHEAIEWVSALAEFDPIWIEEPTSPDDILGHAKIKQALSGRTGVATGEHCHNRIMFKQFLEAGAIDFVQLDGCRLAGLNEVLAVLLLAAKFDKPVCPHAGGVGLCEYAQHYSMIDYVAVSGATERRRTEHAGALHEHFETPITVKNGRYMAPTEPGFSAVIKPQSLETFRFPDGTYWQSRTAGRHLAGEG